MKHAFWIASLVTTCLAACAPHASGPSDDTAISPEDQLIAQLIDAKPGDIIEVPEGKLSFDRGLSLTVDGVTLKGQGMDKSILSFTNQVAGAEGLLVRASNFTIEDLAIEDAKGDALKVNEGDNIVIRRVRTEWMEGPKTENGAYGIYPVQTTNVLVEESVAIGASDAGIYVGQSKNVVVRNNRAELNVAGIEIENTIDADVYGNVATNNTGGILVFNMPELMQAGSRTRVFKNEVIANNTANFGHEGTAVAGVPAGTGVIVNANDAVEIFENNIIDNKTGGIVISSLFGSGYSPKTTSETYDPYPESIYIYGNTFSGGGAEPSTPELVALKIAVAGADGRLPDIVWDGFLDEKKMVSGKMPDELRICVDNGDAEVVDADYRNGMAAPKVGKDAYACTLEKLPAVTLAGVN